MGGAASAAFSPDLLKAIDPTGAVLSPGQQAAMAGFATLLGGGLAGLAGANARGGVTAAENEVLNNTDNHPEDAAKNGGVLSTLSDTFVNALTAFSAARSQGQSQFLQLMQSGANIIMSEPHWVQAAQGINNGMAAAPEAGGGPTAGPDLAPVGPSFGTGQTARPVTGGAPQNATFSSSANGDDAPAPSLGDNPIGGSGNSGSDANTPATSGGTANATTLQGLKGQLANENLANIAAQDPRLAAAVNGSDGNLNYSIGTGTSAEADQLGSIWVGDGAKKTSDGSGLVSADGTRVYRFPT